MYHPSKDNGQRRNPHAITSDLEHRYRLTDRTELLGADLIRNARNFYALCVEINEVSRLNDFEGSIPRVRLHERVVQTSLAEIVGLGGGTGGYGRGEGGSFLDRFLKPD